jgi:hypothetical protein
MDRNYLAGRNGDANNAILAAVGYNFRRLVAHAFILPRPARNDAAAKISGHLKVFLHGRRTSSVGTEHFLAEPGPSCSRTFLAELRLILFRTFSYRK